MKEPRLIMGRPVVRYVLEGLVVSVCFFLMALWGVSHSLKLINRYLESARLSEPLFIVYTMHYGFLFGAIGVFIFIPILLKEILFQAFEWDKKPISAKVDKVFIAPLISIVFLIVLAHP